MKTAVKQIVNDLQDKISWKLLDMYYNQPNVAVSHQIDSFNEFVDNYIPSIIRKNMPFITGIGAKNFGPDNAHYQVEYILDIVNFTCVKPTQVVDGVITNLYPNECRLRSCSYSAKTYITLLQKTVDYSDPNIPDGKVTEEEPIQIPFFKLPIMLRSKYCHLYGLSPDQLNELGEDRYEPGGYFIVNGNEKVIVSQERITDNQFLVWDKSKAQKHLVSGEIKSTMNQLFYPVKSNRIYIFDSIKQESYIKKNFKELSEKVPGAQIYYNVDVTRMRDFNIPIAVMFRAYGIVSDRDITLLITETTGTSVYTKWIQGSLRLAHEMGINTQQDALNFLASLKNDNKEIKEEDSVYIASFLDKDVLPHLLKDNVRKGYYIGTMVKKCIDCYLGITEYNDRDHYSNKRVNLAGHLLLEIFRGRFIGLISKLTQSSVKSLNNDNKYTSAARDIGSIDFTNAFETSLATGKFKTGYYDSGSESDAVCQQYYPHSYISRIAQARKIQSPISKASATITKPKQLHESQCAFTCLNETPEGGDVGMIKNFALTCSVSLYSYDYAIITLIRRLCSIKNYNVVPVNEYPIGSPLNNKVKIYNNADLLAFADNSDIEDIYNDLVVCKRHNIISPYCSIEMNPYERTLVIHSDGGRFIRPVLIVEDNEVLLYKRIREDKKFAEDFFNDKYKFTDLLISTEKFTAKDTCNRSNGAYIEFIDPLQTDFSMIAMREKDVIEAKNHSNMVNENQMYKKFTHCEIHPIVMQGLVSSIIPFSDHTPNPRNNYQCSMGKQAIGIFATNYNKRFDTVANALVTGQDPIVATNTMKYLCLDKLPHGVEAMLAIACYTGYNQEDSIVVNKSSIERGFFNTLNYRTYTEIESKHISINEYESFGKPDINTGKQLGDTYKAINDSGEPKLFEKVTEGDILIGKTLTIKERKNTIKRDKSLAYDQDHGIIDLVLSPKTYRNFPFVAKCTKENVKDNTDNTIIRVRVSNYRLPVLGDKFASRYAQKGTISGLISEADMPFTEHGEVPDIIMNPHGMPSRATLGKPIELFLGTIGLLKGKKMNATPFDYVDLEKYEEELRSLDFTRANSESIMYNGMTGNKFNVKIFYGPMYYQRLKHMVEDKVFSRRDGGKIQTLTRQPAEGRSREGGLRTGEMERDCFIAHNATKVLKGKFFDESDKFKVFISKENGHILVANEAENRFEYNGHDIRESGDNYYEAQMPYAMKLLLQELNCLGMNIVMKSN